MSLQKVFDIHEKTNAGRLFECFRSGGARTHFLMMLSAGPAAGYFKPFYEQAVEGFAKLPKSRRTPSVFCKIIMHYYDELERREGEPGDIYRIVGAEDDFDKDFVLAISAFNPK